ncbi:hypothetical protein VNO77_30437 [Canavalia gladiata]|uniref:2-oxoglutarate-dependent dioxygenase DAO n=1 Tax=Canavalia gladiata TaxID=3824 RepID=A0AAN9KR34_CANGL
MGSKSESDEMIPCVEISREKLGLEEGSEEWKKMSKRVKEACENHGCFFLIYDEIPKVQCEDMYMALKALFDLPQETKKKHTSPKPYRGYNSDCPIIPLCQSFGIDNAPLSNTVEAFTDLMWPQGNPTFCETLKSTSSKMLEATSVILKMILEGYGLPKHYSSDVEDMNWNCNFRLMKYKAPEGDKDFEAALLPHTDKSSLTILSQNGVQGLQVLSKTNKWIELKIPEEGFVVIVGDVLKAWSNGRLHAATHRVMMSGDKERFSFALFAVPKEEMKIEVPSELVDDKMHPLRYKPFNYGDYFQYFISTLKEDALDAFASVS